MTKTTQKIGTVFTGNRGILGLDEGIDRLKDRFLSARFEWQNSTLRDYLELMIHSRGLNQYINAITLSDHAARLLDSDADIFAKCVVNKGYLLGIRADLGYERSSLLKREMVTRGMVGLEARLSEYKTWGANYTTWRNKYYITTNTPTKSIIELNNQETLEFVALSLKHKLQPIIQIKISTNGNQTAEACSDVLSIILEDLFARAEIMGIDSKDIVLQTNFITPGKYSTTSLSPADVANKTMELFKKIVPSDIAGVAFVCDGLRPGFARMYLEEFKSLLKKQKKSFPVTFSFGRGLHDSAMLAWAGNTLNKDDAQVSLVQNSRLDWIANS
jgi:fructose-bisphosphate aldolase, class I